MKKLGKIIGWIVAVVILLFVAVMFLGDDADSSTEDAQSETENVVFENDDFKVTYTGVEKATGLSGCCLIDLTIENKTSGTVSVYLQNASYNDEMANVVSGVTNTITAGKKSNQPYTLLFNSEDMTIDDLETISFAILILDENAATVLTTDQISIDIN